MRRKAEIAQSALNGALHALHAARDAAREALAMASALSIAPDEARAIREAAARHLGVIEQALLHAEAAASTASELSGAVDRAEISRFEIPVLPPQAGA